MRRRGEGLRIGGTPKLTNSSHKGVHPSMTGKRADKKEKPHAIKIRKIKESHIREY